MLQTLSRRQFHQQEAIWELFHTEATYIKKLKVITDVRFRFTSTVCFQFSQPSSVCGTRDTFTCYCSTVQAQFVLFCVEPRAEMLRFVFRSVAQLFLCGLLDLQDTGLLNEVEPAKLFNNIQDLVRVHTALWSQVMLPALRKARQDRSVLDPTDLFEGFQTVSLHSERARRTIMFQRPHVIIIMMMMVVVIESGSVVSHCACWVN